MWDFPYFHIDETPLRIFPLRGYLLHTPKMVHVRKPWIDNRAFIIIAENPAKTINQ